MQQAVAMKKEENPLLDTQTLFKKLLLNDDSEEKNQKSTERVKRLAPWEVPTEEEKPHLRAIGPFILVEINKSIEDNLRSIIISRTVRHMSLMENNTQFELSIEDGQQKKFQFFAEKK